MIEMKMIGDDKILSKGYDSGEIPGLIWNLRWHGTGSFKPKVSYDVALAFINIKREII